MRAYLIYLFGLMTLVGLAAPGAAQDARPSQCLAIAQALPQVQFASFELPAPRSLPFRRTAYQPDPVKLTYVGHSTYRLETAGGVIIATDYNDWAGAGPVPKVVTMNKAHSGHYSDFPDPAIQHPLTGWNPSGDGPIRHHLEVDDVLIRNVATDIRSFDGGLEPYGNSIFIFEVADLCIGHLGHLHHMLDDSHFAAIGRLDILMMPIDGGLTLSHGEMAKIARRLRSSLILPMHRRGSSIKSFTDRLGPGFAVEFSDSDSVEISARTLPTQPTILILRGV